MSDKFVRQTRDRHLDEKARSFVWRCHNKEEKEDFLYAYDILGLERMEALQFAAFIAGAREIEEGE